METTKTATATVRKASEGQRLNVLGDNLRLLLTGRDTHGQYTLVEQHNDPGAGIPPHVHTREDEVFHVLAGAVAFDLNGTVATLGPGELVHVPRGVAHGFRVVGEGPATVLVSAFPAGIEDMFQELVQLPAGPPDFVRVAEICGRYGITFL